MENNHDTPRPVSVQKQDTPDPLAAAENNSDLLKNVDADDATNAGPETTSLENKEQDGDDAVHKGYTPQPDPAHENDEHDLDDRVHGKL